MPANDIVSIVPYFRINSGAEEDFRQVVQAMVERTRSEPACLYYEYCFNGDMAFCREAYRGAEGLLAHIKNVGDLVQQALQHSSLAQLEVHGAADEIAKLREPLTDLNPEYFTLEYGFRND